MSTRARVSMVRCSDYDPSRVHEAVLQAVTLIGGIGVVQGKSVFVKPNLLAAKPPDRLVTTHPAVVEAISRIYADAGAVVSIGDSPPLAGEKESGYQNLLDVTGMSGAAARTGATIVRLEDAVVTVENPGGRFFRRFEVGQAAMEADIFVNVPKLKTHGLTLLTGAVKNVFGVVPGRRKALFHAQAGEDRQTFSQMLADLLGAIPPQLSIMDAVVAMEGEGPADGRPKEVGLILASTDAVALDAVASVLMGLEPMRVDTTRICAQQGLGVGDLAEIEIVGEPLVRSKFLLPTSANLWTRVPAPVRTLLKNQLIPFPVVSERCENCGACVEECPVQTIQAGAPHPAVELSRCIRCYCCREVCGFGAIDLRVGRLSKGVGMIKNARRAVLKGLGFR